MPGPYADREPVLPLQGLYLYLVRAGLPLSVRDYEDALRALRLGHGAGGREALQLLCRRLWARNEEEDVRLQAAFKRFPWPQPGDVERLIGAVATGEAAAPEAAAQGIDDAPEPLAPVAADDSAPRAEFGAASEAGMALPSARVGSRAVQGWVFQVRPPLAVRALVIAWRRYRLAQRSGPPVELDLDATVAEQCRTGWLLRPVLVPARRNQARLLVLVDASPSMRAWRGLHEPLAESLQQSRLRQASLLYFDNDPLEGLFDQPGQGREQDCAQVLKDHGGGAVLVIGDAGAARGHRDRQRQAGTRLFAQAVRKQGASLAWLNPMPRERWGEAARPLQPHAVMEELSEAGLTRAIDFIRGKHGA